MRHADSGAAHFIAEHVSPDVAVINGGDGRHAHPTQGMLDMLTIRRHKGSFDNLSVAIVGDILHSRVARSNMLALRTLGCPDIRVIAPKTLLPEGIEQYGVRVFTDMNEGLRDVDVVIMLRLQRERMQGGLLPSEGEFYKLYGLTTQRLALARPDAIVMHPGPINRGVEIESAVADGPQSVILNQSPTASPSAWRAVHGDERPDRAAPDRFRIRIRGAAVMVATRILGARVIDPNSGRDEVADIFLQDGRITAIGQAPAGFEAQQTIDAQGLIAAPARRSLGRPARAGLQPQGTIASETLAAAAGGITSLCCRRRARCWTPPRWPS